jgi:threonine synthase
MVKIYSVKTGLIESHKKHLPVTEATPVILPGKGGMPLLYANLLKEFAGGRFQDFLKCEGVNPTGSFMDRGMTPAISKAAEAGEKTVICASAGNTSVSAVSVAGFIKLDDDGFFEQAKKGVAVVTLAGRGLKDPYNVLKETSSLIHCKTDKTAIISAMGMKP